MTEGGRFVLRLDRPLEPKTVYQADPLGTWCVIATCPTTDDAEQVAKALAQYNRAADFAFTDETYEFRIVEP